MSSESTDTSRLVHFESSRFGPLSVTAESIITFPSGLVGFPKPTDYVLIEHKPPFSWLHGVDVPAVAFVVVDGFELGYQYDLSLPFSQAECDFQESDEYAILVIVTVRSDPRLTTVNMKAPVFVNIRNRRGVQVIYDSPDLSTRAPLYDVSTLEAETQKQAQSAETASASYGVNTQAEPEPAPEPEVDKDKG